ncbi:MAG TPA: NADH-quinone oxidoreductase subunit M, partial [Candidatus Bathyarchaeia archaeon]|nr:NADH-quinone oxidoreductase subunit M [Candidatus Bathyarchaeia archaeon]
AFVLLVIGLLVAIGLSTAYSFITIKRIFFGPPSPEISNEPTKERRDLLFPIIVIAIIGILLFFWPAIFIDPLSNLVRSLLR